MLPSGSRGDPRLADSHGSGEEQARKVAQRPLEGGVDRVTTLGAGEGRPREAPELRRDPAGASASIAQLRATALGFLFGFAPVVLRCRLDAPLADRRDA